LPSNFLTSTRREMLQKVLSGIIGMRPVDSPDLVASSVPGRPEPLSQGESYDLGVSSGAGREKVPEWFALGEGTSATHMIVMKDSVNNVEYPVFSTAGKDIEAETKMLNGENACFVIVVFNFREDINAQLDGHIRFNY